MAEFRDEHRGEHAQHAAYYNRTAGRRERSDNHLEHAVTARQFPVVSIAIIGIPVLSEHEFEKPDFAESGNTSRDKEHEYGDYRNYTDNCGKGEQDFIKFFFYVGTFHIISIR